jgi:phosphopantetheinyl transferase
MDDTTMGSTRFGACRDEAAVVAHFTSVASALLLPFGGMPTGRGLGAVDVDAQAGRVLGPRSGLGEAEGPLAPEDPSRSMRPGKAEGPLAPEDPSRFARVAEVTLMLAPFHADDALSAACERLLAPAERERAGRLATADVRRRFVQRRAFRRYAAALATGSQASLASLDFATEPKGRPWLPAAPGVSWSVSSCRSGMLVAWSRGAEIGVDLEDRARQADCLPLARRYFAPEEARLVIDADESDRMETFLRLWCLKEAVLKAIGEGIAFGLDRFVFALDPEVRMVTAPEEQGGLSRFVAGELAGASLQRVGGTAAVVLRMPLQPDRERGWQRSAECRGLVPNLRLK